MIITLAIDNKSDIKNGIFESLECEQELYNKLKEEKYYWYKVFISSTVDDLEFVIIKINNKNYLTHLSKLNEFYYKQIYPANKIGYKNNKLLKYNKIGCNIYEFDREGYLNNSLEYKLDIKYIDFNIPPCILDEDMIYTLQNITMIR